MTGHTEIKIYILYCEDDANVVFSSAIRSIIRGCTG